MAQRHARPPSPSDTDVRTKQNCLETRWCLAGNRFCEGVFHLTVHRLVHRFSCCSANKRVMLVMVGVALLAAANAILVPISMEAAVRVSLCACTITLVLVHAGLHAHGASRETDSDTEADREWCVMSQNR